VMIPFGNDLLGGWAVLVSSVTQACRQWMIEPLSMSAGAPKCDRHHDDFGKLTAHREAIYAC